MRDKNPCERCDLCCRHIAVEIDKPETDEEYDQIRWFLLHRDVWIFIDNDDSWNLQVNNKCKRLGKGGWCEFYDKRPIICKKYSSDNCEGNGEGDSFRALFRCLEDFEKWAARSGKK